MNLTYLLQLLLLKRKLRLPRGTLQFRQYLNSKGTIGNNISRRLQIKDRTGEKYEIVLKCTGNST